MYWHRGVNSKAPDPNPPIEIALASPFLWGNHYNDNDNDNDNNDNNDNDNDNNNDNDTEYSNCKGGV